MKIVSTKKIKGVYCCAFGCKHDPVKKLGGLCPKHYQRKVKIRDPVYNRYMNLKGNALRRGKDFTITLDEFKLFCQRTGYIITKGLRGKNATIDRRCNAQGYHIWNIQLLTNFQNIRKYWDHDRKSKECVIELSNKYTGYKEFLKHENIF